MHGMNICMECEAVISQCRCPDHHMTIHTVCEKCVTKKKNQLPPPSEILTASADFVEVIEQIRKLTLLADTQSREVERYRQLFYTYYSHYRIVRDCLVIYADQPNIGERAREVLAIIKSMEDSRVPTS